MHENSTNSENNNKTEEFKPIDILQIYEKNTVNHCDQNILID